MPIESAVRKGDIVALKGSRSWTFAIGSGGGTKRKEYWTLAKVNSASRSGEANSLVRAGGHVKERRRRDFSLADVYTISPEYQPKARAAFAKLTWDSDEFDSQEGLRVAVRGY